MATVPAGEVDGASLNRLHDDLMVEYAKLVDLVTGLDNRLLTIKGWGVTLSLATLGLGFSQDHFGLFLIAAVSAAAFWIVEGSTKSHQIRYYPRMSDIEVAAYKLFSVHSAAAGPVTTPLINWSWDTASARIRRGTFKGDPRIPQPWPDKLSGSDRVRNPLTYVHVMFPRILTFVAGTTLFVVGLCGALGPI